jgi:hypothetical protein
VRRKCLLGAGFSCPRSLGPRDSSRPRAGAAVAYGIEARKNGDNAIVTASDLPAKAGDEESGKILQLVAASQQQPQQGPLPALRAAVVEKAPELLAS